MHLQFEFKLIFKGKTFGKTLIYNFLYSTGVKVLRIKAKNVSEENKYIQSATFNGRPFSTTVLSHEEIMKGGTLVFEMGPEPDPGWGL